MKKKLKDKGYPIIKVSVIKDVVNSNLHASNSKAPGHRTLDRSEGRNGLYSHSRQLHHLDSKSVGKEDTQQPCGQTDLRDEQMNISPDAEVHP